MGENRGIVLASHLPGEGHFESIRFTVRPVECADRFDYWRALATLWDQPVTIINVEHDVEATDEHIAALLACPSALCRWQVPLHWASTGQPGMSFGGIGLVKLAANVRVRPLRREPWQRVELAVADAVTGAWCEHGPPVAHHHW